ncbi:protein translocase subunit SecD [Corynebacterium sp. H130]|uniref:protein translocase subunit SecD n=1 Tax=Corynebacterium sp. H130 TaxID=3133444 RepID=UPI0030A08B72
MSTSGRPKSRRSWPFQAIALFFLVLFCVYGLVFFTGDRTANPKLGIDLQGGTRVTLVPQGAEPTQDQLAQARLILENRVNGMGVTGASVVTDGNTLVITVPGEDTTQARALGQTSQLMFRPVIQPGTPEPHSLYETANDMANRWVEKGVITPDQANETLKGLVDSLNQGLGEGQAPLEVKSVTAAAPQEAKNSVEATKRRQEITEMLRGDRQSEDTNKQFASAALLRCDQDMDPLAGSDDPAKPFIACDETGQKHVLAPVPLLVGEPENGKRLTGNEIDSNRPINGGLNPQTGQMEIGFSFKSDGGEQGGATWAKVTQDNLGSQVAITLDSKIISAPVIQGATPAGSATAITGNFTQQEATDLANNLKYGALPLSFAGENGERGGTTTTIPASLGTASLKAGLIAGLVGLIAVALYALAYYRVFGVLALFTLVASGVLVYGTLILLGRWIGYSLDLAGVAGLIIGIGTTADSFVVFYERIKDEIRDGRTFRSSVPRAWDSAKRTVLTGNFVSLIAAVVLYILAVGEVKGFAFTLGLTTVFDLLVTFLLTGPLVILASRKPWFARNSVNGLGAVAKVADRRRHDGEFDGTDRELAEEKN